jgi:serpin B
MNKFICLALLCAAPQAFAQDGAVAARPDAAKSGAAMINAPAAKLFAQLSRPGENLVFSPYSLAVAMGMAYDGARGNTAAQIAAAMGFAGQNDTRSAFADTVKRLAASSGGNQFLSANGFWARAKFPFRPEYISELQTGYGAEAHNFGKSPAKEINKWVAEKTLGTIDRILAPADINRMSELLLVNSVYFRGTWKGQFKEQDTQPAPFYVSKSDSYTVPLMHKYDSSESYAETADCQILSKDYAGGDFSLTVFLPKETDGLPELEQQLAQDGFDKMAANLQPAKVDLYLPRFEIKNSMDMIPPLKALGVTDAFGPGADLSGMDGKTDLDIALVRQLAVIKTDERGTKAAAATAVKVSLMAMPPITGAKPVVFRADHPFIYVLRHNATGAILFAGEYGKQKLQPYKPGELQQIDKASNGNARKHGHRV